jgi:dinuclear metal center YbgI/SA1388 family protein
MKIKELISFLNEIAPYSLQEPYDNSGVITGNSDNELTGILVSLDATEPVVDEAIALGVNVVLSHHPIVFKGFKSLTGKNYIERTVIKAIKNDICIIAIHTNLDNVVHGVNKVIADKLGLLNTKILFPKENTLSYLQVYTPKSHLSDVQNALSNAGAGKLGEYDSCSFHIEGIGQFKPLSLSDPFIGSKNKLEKVDETKIECIVQNHYLPKVLNALKAAHPYEEISYQVIPVKNEDPKIGSGMIGELSESCDLIQAVSRIKEVFNAGVVRYTETGPTKIKKIAVCGGSGSFLLEKAKQAGADLFLTADFKYHDFFDAENDIIIADIGHFESEQFTSDYLVAQLKEKFTNFAVHLTNVNTNPIKYL